MRRIIVASFVSLFALTQNVSAQPWVSCDLTITHPLASGTSSSGGDVVGLVRHYEMAETGDGIWSNDQGKWRSISSNGKFTLVNDFVKIVAKGQGSFGNHQTWKAALVVEKTVNAEGSCQWIDQE